ncbi:MAG TPA: hypothetical protein VKT25_11085 [Ktedonobacteraceae bacterium]|nr:hypothetical protein [Ktedonobacteraceae bacterium]
MGLNIGFEVQQQRIDAGYSGPIILPKESLEELNEKFHDFLEQRFPEHGDMFGHSVEVWVAGTYTFDCRMGHYGHEFGKRGFEMEQLYQAIFEFILTVFSYDDLQIRTYHNP